MATITDHDKDNARAKLDDIINLSIRLDHATKAWHERNECTVYGCQVTDQRIAETLDIYPARPITDEDRESYHDEDEARARIEESVLEIAVRSGWSSPGDTLEPDQYRITLTTGGPACRIIGDLYDNSEPDTARIEYQDWGTPWTELPISSVEHTRLVEYAQWLVFID
jgi:hypothetical protein